jgi:hypothetical protein
MYEINYVVELVCDKLCRLNCSFPEQFKVGSVVNIIPIIPNLYFL